MLRMINPITRRCLIQRSRMIYFFNRRCYTAMVDDPLSGRDKALRLGSNKLERSGFGRQRLLRRTNGDDGQGDDGDDQDESKHKRLKHITKMDTTVNDRLLYISPDFIQRCTLDVERNKTTEKDLKYPVLDTFRQELMLSLTAAIHYTKLKSRSSDNQYHIALRSTSDQPDLWLNMIVKLVAHDMKLNLCILDPWLLQELFDSIITNSDDKWPIYPRRVHDSGLAKIDDKFIESNTTSMDESVDEEEEEELSEEEEMTVNHFVQELEKMKLRTNKEIPLEEYMRTTFLHLIQKSATITGTTLPLLIHLRDALDISRTEVGSIAIRSLLYAIQDYRIQGGQVALIANCTPTLLFSVDVDIQYLFGISGIIWESFILMRAPDAPVTDEGIDLPLLQEEWRRIQISEINQRNLQRTLRQRHVDYDLSDLYQMVPESNLEIWTFDKIIRIVNAAIGLMKLSKATHVTSSSIAEALTIINSNLNYLNTELSDVEEKEQDGPIVRDDLDEHEKKLLGCIVNTNVMKTTFRDVVAPPAAIRTLQTLITLPLLYPKHFSYGVLSDHSISGVLLFGPPGTGKTMLARAVATESGSSMLEIKGSDINDKYVGESEKNVGAIFSLARKMAPCVIFIDEVDALFSARSSSANDVSKRETINQFMAEWDGLRSSALNRGITVLCATNRPFDLDDAVLRRMPRRILVDLPDEKDRQKILTFHLRQEQLDGSITVEELAKRTPLYSGSDLKNLCVTAALAAVREQIAGEHANENDILDLDAIRERALAQHQVPGGLTGERVLSRRHFELALKEIAPSCSDEMQTLAELRRWDRLYGDRGGRSGAFRRKAMGFGTEQHAVS